MVGFLSANPEFDLGTTNIEVFLKKSPPAAAAASGDGAAPSTGPRSLGAVLAEQPLKEALKAVQRVFKVAPKYRQTKALLDAGVHSAAAVHAMGEKRFVARFGGTDAFT